MITRDLSIIRARFYDEWPTTIPVMSDFGPEQTRPTGLHVHFAIRPTEVERYLGDRVDGSYLAHGRVHGTIFAPRGTAEKVMTDTLDQFARVFRNWQSDDLAINFFPETFGGTGIDPATGMLYAAISVYYESIRPYRDDE